MEQYPYGYSLKVADAAKPDVAAALVKIAPEQFGKFVVPAKKCFHCGHKIAGHVQLLDVMIGDTYAWYRFDIDMPKVSALLPDATLTLMVFDRLENKRFEYVYKGGRLIQDPHNRTSTNGA